MSNQPNSADDNDLQETLASQPGLYDLHTHLMGNGSYKFWIEEILESEEILPKHDDFLKNEVSKNICPLIWNEVDNCFVNGNVAAKFISELRTIDFPLGAEITNIDYTGASESEKEALKRFIGNTSFMDRLTSLGLSFGNDFSYDVVLKLSDLGKGFGAKESVYDDFIQIEVEEKLGILRSREDGNLAFRHYIVFNARKQHFEIVFGIKVETLRELIKVDQETSDSPQALARGHLINAFSMCHSDGTPAGHIDFHGFHGAFTPEFYPRRFALKDSIYEQRLDVLFLLLRHIFDNYQNCKPPIVYCELSVSIGDLSEPWIFEILRSIKTPSLDNVQFDDSVLKKDIRKSQAKSKFCALIEEGHFHHLKDKLSTNVIYKFLAGFKRQNLQSPIPSDQMGALSLLNEAPQLAIYYMLQEIARSDSDSNQQNHGSSKKSDSESIFYPLIDDLLKFQKKASEIPEFYHWVVGIDLFGDELGYPYCPFVARPFIEYVLNIRKKANKCFGMRIHCGENVMFADNDIGSHRLFVAHMYIVFRCLRYLQRKLKYGIRIGHGIAFERILSDDMHKTTHRKSAVLLAEIRQHAKHVLKTIAFEVNITSNEYLLRYSIRQANHNQTHKLDALFRLGIPVFLSTDDDGVWPIQGCKFKRDDGVCPIQGCECRHDGGVCPSQNCKCKHANHCSLAAEYCRALSSSIFKSRDSLEKAFEDTKKFCFFPMRGIFEMPIVEFLLPEDDKRVSTIIFHPDLIKAVLRKCYKAYGNNHNEIKNDLFCQQYSSTYRSGMDYLIDNNDDWINLCKSMAPLAYVAHCTDESAETLQNIGERYHRIFGSTIKLSDIHQNWSNIRMQLMFPNFENRGQHVSICNEKYVFLSEQPLSEAKVPEHLINFLQDNYHRDVQINAYARHVDVLQFLTKLKEQLKRPCHSSLSVTLYTNRDKTKRPAFNIDGKKIQVLIDHNPLKRTYIGRTQENAFYIICPHARAATAALHFVSYILTERDLPQSIQPHTSTNINRVDSIDNAVIHISTAKSSTPDENNISDSKVLPTMPELPINPNNDETVSFYGLEDKKRRRSESESVASSKKNVQR